VPATVPHAALVDVPPKPKMPPQVVFFAVHPVPPVPVHAASASAWVMFPVGLQA
jgi:hypothetical protein